MLVLAPPRVAPIIEDLATKIVAPDAPHMAMALGDVVVMPEHDIVDVMHQIAWYKAQGMLNPEIDGNTIIDARYVKVLPVQ